MKTERPHRKLIAWQRAMELVETVYALTSAFPKQEVYGLTNQMRRAVISVPSNLAEGAAGRSRDQFKNYLAIAAGSLSELDTQIEIALRLSYLTEKQHADITEQIDQCSALINGLKRSLT
jgi:four helix bundle protein